MARRLSLCAIFIVLAACTAGRGRGHGVLGTDSGSSGPDSDSGSRPDVGAAADASVSPEDDAAFTEDAASTRPDAGHDAAVPITFFDAGHDAGTSFIDAGHDSGVTGPRPDAGPGYTVLIFDDYTAGPADGAATDAALTSRLVDTGADFATAFDAGGFSIVVIESASENLPTEVTTRLATWVPTHPTVFSYWNLNADSATQSVLGVTAASSFTTARTVFPVSGAIPALFAGVTTPMVPMDTVTDDGDELTPASGSTIGRFDSATGPGALVITHSGRTVVMGFCPDEMVVVDMRKLYTNIYSFLTP